jgi:hypothetical protein
LIDLIDLMNLTNMAKGHHLETGGSTMAQVRRQVRLSPAKGKRLRKRVARKAATGEFAIFRIGKHEIKLPFSEAVLKMIGKRKNERNVRRLLAGYVDVAEKAARAGHAVDYTLRVTPGGEAEPVTKLDALDAALTAAKARGQVKVAEILKGDDMLTASDFGSLIGASHETVNVRRRRGEILGLQAATRAVRYPSWQVTDAGLTLPGLPRLFEVLGRQPWTVYRFLRTAHAELDGRTALDALKAGQDEDVLNVARNQANGVFS